MRLFLSSDNDHYRTLSIKEHSITRTPVEVRRPLSSSSPMLMQPVYEQNIPGGKNGDYIWIQQSVPKQI